jgi:hypothetical protein
VCGVNRTRWRWLQAALTAIAVLLTSSIASPLHGDDRDRVPSGTCRCHRAERRPSPRRHIPKHPALAGVYHPVQRVSSFDQQFDLARGHRRIVVEIPTDRLPLTARRMCCPIDSQSEIPWRDRGLGLSLRRAGEEQDTRSQDAQRQSWQESSASGRPGLGLIFGRRQCVCHNHDLLVSPFTQEGASETRSGCRHEREPDTWRVTGFTVAHPSRSSRPVRGGERCPRRCGRCRASRRGTCDDRRGAGRGVAPRADGEHGEEEVAASREVVGPSRAQADGSFTTHVLRDQSAPHPTGPRHGAP